MTEGAKPAPFPGFVEPCAPTARQFPPPGDGWLHEIKHDGYRLQAHVREGAVSLYTNHRGNDWALRMPTIAASVRALPVNNVILDGELVAVDAKGNPVSYELTDELKKRVKAKLVFYAFDLLYLDGFDLRPADLVDRKRVLEALLGDAKGVQLVKHVDHIAGNGELVLEHACKLGLEGIVSKRADAPYRSGRSTDWIKTKCEASKKANRDRFEKTRKKPDLS
jgi:bifunctional non-homologous end joining protein LigD